MDSMKELTHIFLLSRLNTHFFTAPLIEHKIDFTY